MVHLTNRVSEISEFVRKAMGMPQADQFDWWQESAHAALFSSSFEPFLMFAYAETHSERDFNNLLHLFTKELAEKASLWVEKGFSESISSEYRNRIKAKEGSFAQEIQNRLKSYFIVATTAMADRNYDIETARSHSCFAVLSKIYEDLLKVDKSVSFEQFKILFENTIVMCEVLANDIHGEIQRILKQDSI